MLLVFGTQMPGAWRDEAFRVAHLPWQMTKVARFVVFASNRDPSWLDVGIDMAGAALGVVLARAGFRGDR